MDTLVEAAVEELRSNHDAYHLIGDYEKELDEFLNAKIFNRNSIDTMAFALAEITQTCATIFTVDQNDRTCSKIL